MKKLEEFIRQHRRQLYDLFEVAVHDILYRQRFTVAHDEDYTKFLIYIDCTEWSYLITFPADILYIKLKKREFREYIFCKLEF